jgi:pimeloyl-ACP methyl ester carboxylesterase
VGDLGARLGPLLVRVLAGGALLLVLYWALLFFAQRAILFPAPSVRDAPPRPPDARQVWLESSVGRTEAWLFQPLPTPAGPAPLLMFAHGNGELIDYWPGEFEKARRLGLAVLLVEYPGYGRSGGSPSRESIKIALEAAYDFAVAEPSIDRGRVVFYGRSLGGAAVAELSKTRVPKAMILESTFTSTMAFASAFAAPGLLVRDRYDTLSVLSRYRGPLLVVHGERDSVVSIEHGRRLADAAHVTLRVLDCGHNDCPGPWDVLPGFLRETGVL